MIFAIVCKEAAVDLTCKEYLEGAGLGHVFNPTNHNVFYSLHKTENISDSKVLWGQYVPTNEWTYDTHKVRAILGLPLTGNVTINPQKIKAGYRLFVQSTSWNRKIKAGTHCVVEVTEEQFDSIDGDSDTQMSHITASIGTDTSVPELEDISDAESTSTLTQTFASRLQEKKRSPTKKPTPEKKPKTKKAAPTKKTPSKVKNTLTKETKKTPAKKTITSQPVKRTRKLKKIGKRDIPKKKLIRSRTMRETVSEGYDFLLACQKKEKKNA